MRTCKNCGLLFEKACANCHRISSALYKAKNKEKVKESQKKYENKNKEKIRILRKKYYLLNKYNNNEILKERRKRYYENNKDHHKEIVRNYRNANLELCKSRVRVWSKENPEVRRALANKYRTRKINAQGIHTKNDIKSLFLLQQGKCACCKININKNYHIDHIIPLAKGGSNDKFNIQLLCPTCNLQKGVKHPIEFMQKKGFLL
jgi:5-methylcytosine-specific restriction endonuclease McrA